MPSIAIRVHEAAACFYIHGVPGDWTLDRGEPPDSLRSARDFLGGPPKIVRRGAVTFIVNQEASSEYENGLATCILGRPIFGPAIIMAGWRVL